MKVLHLTETWKGGCGVYVSALIRWQLRNDAADKITLLCCDHRAPADLAIEADPRLEVRRYRSSRKPTDFAHLFKELKAVIREEQPDLIHAHSTFAGLYAHFAAGEIPVVYCAHGWSFSQELPGYKEFLFAQVERWLSRNRTATYHISQDEQRRAHRWGVRSPYDRVIRNGVAMPTAESESPPIEVDPTKINLCFLGRFDRQKGADILDREFAQVAREDIRLYVIGGFDRDRAPANDEPLQDGPRIKRLGWIEHQEMDHYLRCFDAVVVPSRWEGFGLVVTEAMRNGVPAIASNRGGLTEQIIDGYNGTIFTLDQEGALAACLDSMEKEALVAMKEPCLAVFKNCFDEKYTFSAVHQLYCDVIDNR